MSESPTLKRDGRAADGAARSLGAFRSKADLVYEFLRERIVSAYYPPGHRLIATRIAREVGTSALPVREALNRLQAEGLVQMRRHTGTTVAPVDVTRMRELFEIRLELECYATRRAAPVLADSGARDLKKLLFAQRERVEKGDAEGYGTLDNRFHRLICVAPGNRSLVRAIDELRTRTEHCRVIFRRIPGYMERSWEDHWDIVHALSAGDGDRAEALMRAHIERAFRFALREMEG